MKMQILLTQASLLLVMALFGVACAKKNQATAETPPVVAAVDPTAPGTPTDDSRETDVARGSEWMEGATAPLAHDSLSVFSNYVASHPLNNPTDLRISVKTYDVGSNRYAGKVMISYFDNNQYYTGTFLTEDAVVARNTSHGHDYSPYAVYNKWFIRDGKPVYHGFYSDLYGAVMLIVDQSIDQGDGAGASEYAGEIWYKNFAIARTEQGYIPCQFVEVGPYDCRTFLTGSESLTTTSALYPSESTYPSGGGARGWKRLGRFSGLKASRAFGGQ